MYCQTPDLKRFNHLVGSHKVRINSMVGSENLNLYFNGGGGEGGGGGQ